MKKKAKAYNWDTKIMSAIRKIWRFSPERRQCLAEATRNGLCICHSCGQWIHPKLVTVDHVDPVVAVTGFESWDCVIQRMRENVLVVLCDPCHRLKTKSENAERAVNRRAQKKKIGCGKTKGCGK
jgi:5-methylcytosine-specific restriction endonuclease McrA